MPIDVKKSSIFSMRPLSYNGVARPDKNDNYRCGCKNETEAVVAVSICRAWVTVSGKFRNRILVLSLHHAQVDAFRSGFRFAKVEGVNVSSVDSAQGLKRDIVIVCLARNRFGGKDAFFEHRKGINVMLRRTRKLLVILGQMKDVTEISSAWNEVLCVIQDMGRSEVENTHGESVDDDHEARGPPVRFYKIQTDNSLSIAGLEF